MERSGGRQKEGSKAGRRGKKEGEEEKGDEAALAAGVGWKMSACGFQRHLLPLLLHQPTITGFHWSCIQKAKLNLALGLKFPDS